MHMLHVAQEFHPPKNRDYFYGDWGGATCLLFPFLHTPPPFFCLHREGEWLLLCFLDFVGWGCITPLHPPFPTRRFWRLHFVLVLAEFKGRCPVRPFHV
jgi:hypothetical protein